MGKREDEPFNSLVYVIAIDLSLFLVLTQCCTLCKPLGITEEDCLKYVVLCGLFC